MLLTRENKNFSKWKTYYEKKADDGRHYSIERDSYYYHYWNAYDIYDINKACTNEYLVNIFDLKNWSVKSDGRRLPLPKVYMWSLPIVRPEEFIREKIKSSLNFSFLSFYVQIVRISANIPLGLYLQKIRNKDYDWELDRKRQLLREKRVAKIAICRHQIILSNAILFLKNLCKKYFEYEEDGMIKLTEMLRFDIYYLRKLIIDGFGLTKEEIEAEIRRSRIRFCLHKNPLKYIFEGELAEAREDVHRIFENSVKQFSLIDEKEAIREEIERFLYFIDENGMENIYLILKKSFHSPKDYRTPHNLIDKLTSLSVYFESYLKALIIKRTSLATSDWFNSDKRSIQSMLNLLFKQESWIGSLNAVLKLEKYKHVTKENINILEKEIQTLELNKNKEANEIVKMFLLINVLRNSVAHDYFKVNNTLENGHVFLSKIVDAMWYCWFRTKKMPYN